jgi:AraC-like DNA-binding protein
VIPASTTTRDAAHSDLAGLDVAIRLKADLLHRLATRRRTRWTRIASGFFTEIARSRLTDRTALVVLLTELCEELRLLFGVRSSAAARSVDIEIRTEFSRSDILGRFEEKVLELLIPARNSPARLSPVGRRAKRLIDERYGCRLTVDQLAAGARCSARQLAHVFRRELGTTVHEYLTRVRLHRALELIGRGEKIEVVSLLVGYRSKKNFYRHFKTHIGVTPLAYRAAFCRSRRM